MLNVRLAGDHLYEKLLFTWLSLAMSMTVSFCVVLFPTSVLDGILNLIESVSEGFPTYSYRKMKQKKTFNNKRQTLQTKEKNLITTLILHRNEIISGRNFCFLFYIFCYFIYFYIALFILYLYESNFSCTYIFLSECVSNSRYSREPLFVQEIPDPVQRYTIPIAE